MKGLQNQGYETETVTGVANWHGESRHVSKIKALIAAGNTHSTHVFEKLGAEYVRDDLTCVLYHPSAWVQRGQLK